MASKWMQWPEMRQSEVWSQELVPARIQPAPKPSPYNPAPMWELPRAGFGSAQLHSHLGSEPVD